MDERRSATRGEDQSRKRALGRSRRSLGEDLFNARRESSFRTRRRRCRFPIRGRRDRRGAPRGRRASGTAHDGSGGGGRVSETGVYYDEKGHPMLGSALVCDPKFQDHVVAETRALLATIPK